MHIYTHTHLTELQQCHRTKAASGGGLALMNDDFRKIQDPNSPRYVHVYIYMIIPTVDGRIGSLSHSLQCFLHPRRCRNCRISSINSSEIG